MVYINAEYHRAFDLLYCTSIAMHIKIRTLIVSLTPVLFYVIYFIIFIYFFFYLHQQHFFITLLQSRVVMGTLLSGKKWAENLLIRLRSNLRLIKKYLSLCTITLMSVCSSTTIVNKSHYVNPISKRGYKDETKILSNLKRAKFVCKAAQSIFRRQ